MFFGFGFGQSYHEKTIDFKQEMQVKKKKLKQILQMPNIINQVRSSSDIFINLLKQNHEYLLQLLDFAFRPELFFQQQNQIHIPYYCVQILCNQDQQLIDYLFKTQFPKPVQNYTNSQLQTTQKSQAPLLTYIFQLLYTSNYINQTSAGYLNKYVNTFVYHKGNQFLIFLNNNPQIITVLINHFYSRSISNIILMILSLQNDEFLNKKSQLLSNILRNLKQQSDQIKGPQKQQNMIILIQQLVQKSHDKYDGSKYIPLMKSFIRLQNLEIIKQIMDNEYFEKQKVQNISQLLNGIIKFYNKDRIDCNSQIVSQIQQRLLVQILEIIKLIQKKIVQAFKNQANQMLKLKLICLMKSIFKKKSSYINKLINQQFIIDQLNLMKQHPHNNILHRTQQQLIIILLKSQYKNIFIQKKTGLVQFILNQFNHHQKYQKSYINQLFHIAAQIDKQSNKNQSFKNILQSQYPQTWHNFIKTIYSQRKKTYLRLLGGENPRQKNNNNQSEDEIIIIESNTRQQQTKNNNNINNKNNDAWIVRSNTQDEINQSQLQDINLEIQSDKSNSDKQQQQQNKVITEKVQQKKQQNIKKQNFFSRNKYWALQIYHNIEDLIMQL